MIKKNNLDTRLPVTFLSDFDNAAINIGELRLLSR